MKRILILCASFLLLIACSDETASNSEGELNLSAPNGDVLASSVTELKKWTATVISDKFGSERQFKLTGIEYLDVKEGFAAKVNFEVANISGAYLIGNFPLRTSGARGGDLLETSAKWRASCAGSSCCYAELDMRSKVISCKCASGENSGCTLKVEQLELKFKNSAL
jgi:hypothetical protein